MVWTNKPSWKRHNSGCFLTFFICKLFSRSSCVYIWNSNRVGSILAGLALSWARALGEFGATITFAGNMPGETQTLPLAIFLALETNPEAALALSLVMIVTSLAILVPFRDQWLPSR